MRDHSHKNETYYECDLCGFVYRESETVINSAGLRVCIEHDYDESNYKFAPPLLSNAQTFKDEITGLFYRVGTVAYGAARILVAVEVEPTNLVNEAYTVTNFDTGMVYLIKMSGGQIVLVENQNGKPFRPTSDLCVAKDTDIPSHILLYTKWDVEYGLEGIIQTETSWDNSEETPTYWVD